MPLPYQIAVIFLTAFFLWAFSVSRNPRAWRRLYQSHFTKKEDFSVNKNKKMDESIKKNALLIAMAFLVADASCVILGATYRYRNATHSQTMEERYRNEDVDRVRANMPKESRRSVGP